MQVSVHYIILGKPKLHQYLTNESTSVREALLTPQLWVHEQGGRSAISLDSYTRAIKRIYIALVRYAMLNVADVERLFGSLPLEDAIFDEWWDIMVFKGHDYRIGSIIQDLVALGIPDIKQLISPISFNHLTVETDLN